MLKPHFKKNRRPNEPTNQPTISCQWRKFSTCLLLLRLLIHENGFAGSASNWARLTTFVSNGDCSMTIVRDPKAGFYEGKKWRVPILKKLDGNHVTALTRMLQFSTIKRRIGRSSCRENCIFWLPSSMQFWMNSVESRTFVFIKFHSFLLSFIKFM